jgi:hypothetical protein
MCDWFLRLKLLHALDTPQAATAGRGDRAFMFDWASILAIGFERRDS